jgi:hypothetical protein
MSEENKSKLLARLKEGRERVKKARAEAKEKGLPDPKPRKARKPKTSDGALENPAAAPANNETVPPIDGAPRNAVNTVAAMVPDPSISKSKPIDVPNLPGQGKEVASKKDIVKDAEAVPEAKPKKDIASTGKPKKYDDNEVLRSEETGNQAIEVNFPGQKESIKKLLSDNKKENKPLAPTAKPDAPSQTVKKVKTHVPEIKAVEARAPFSFAAIRKVLYQ